MNKVILMGNLTRDPEVRYTQGSEPIAVTRFSIAVQRRFKRDGETDVDFINCVCFGKQGETIGKFFTKGRRISVVGRIQNSSWQDKDGNKRISTDIVVDEFYFCDSKSSEGGNSGFTSQQDNNAAAGNNTQSAGYYQVDNSVDDDDLPWF